MGVERCRRAEGELGVEAGGVADLDVDGEVARARGEAKRQRLAVGVEGELEQIGG